MSRLTEIRQKRCSREQIKQLAAGWKAAGERIVFTNGCFDILHPGHIDYLSKAAGLGSKLIIGLNSDASVTALKGPNRPLQDEKARALVLGALSIVDAICIFEEETPYKLISEILPHILVKGSDYNPAQVVGSDIVISHGGSLVLLPYLKGYSTTGIEQKIRKG
jgi:rfaE bifunctional protein nucleotidyltransferase chain/domain